MTTYLTDWCHPILQMPTLRVEVNHLPMLAKSVRREPGFEVRSV